MTASRHLSFVAAGTVLLAGAPAAATYSIVGVDRTSRQVGGAGTSCVAPSRVFVIYGSAPGRGAVASQAASNLAGRNRAVQRLEMEVPPAQIIAELTAPAFDLAAARRQYGIVDVTGRAAGHSGGSNGAFSGDRQGAAGDFNYSVQGNILTGVAVLTQAAAAFERPACDLAERLMRALEAGAANGQGDSRCTPAGVPSDSAFVVVDRPGEAAGSYLRILVDGPRRTNPIPTLRSRFDAWRMTHPCPGGAPDGGAGGRDGAAAVDAAGDAGARGGAGGRGGGADGPADGSLARGGAGGSALDAAAGTGGGTGGTPAGAGGDAGMNAGGAPGMVAPGSGGSAGAPAARPGPPGGCSCRTGASSPGGLAFPALLALLVLVRRSSRGRR